jgi:Fur family zinc uptake transcriptional regulator
MHAITFVTAAVSQSIDRRNWYAITLHMKSPSRFALTPDRLPPRCQLVLKTLRHSPLPLTTCGMLERCRDHGPKTPIQVYRILDRLIASQLVHRIEKTKAYIACQGCHASGRDALFAICEVCGRVAKVEAEEALTCAGRQAAAHGFAPSRIGVEILGRCQACTPQDG